MTKVAKIVPVSHATMAKMRATTIGAALFLTVACGGSPASDAGIVLDAGIALDAGVALDASPEDAGASAWRAEPALPVAVQEIAVEAHAGRIVVAGGLEGTRVVATVRVLDPATGAWTEGPALPAPRHHLALVSHAGDLYALGGMETLAFEPVDTAWVLRAGADAWVEVAPMPIDRGAAAADSVGDRVVVAGGNARRGGLATETLIYAPDTDTWSVGAPIPTPREHLAAVAHEGSLYVVGGRRNSLDTNVDLVEIYDLASDAWRDGPAMPIARGGFDAAALGDAIYVVGGEQPDRALASVDRLDLGAGTWSSAPPTARPHHGHGVVALDGRLYVVGGGDAPNLAPTDVVESFAP